MGPAGDHNSGRALCPGSGRAHDGARRPPVEVSLAFLFASSSQANIVLTGLFALEVAVRMMGLGVRPWMCQPWNVFDAAIVVISVAEIVLGYVDR